MRWKKTHEWKKTSFLLSLWKEKEIYLFRCYFAVSIFQKKTKDHAKEGVVFRSTNKMTFCPQLQEKSTA